MPKRKTTKLEKMLLTEGWKTFGLWLRSQRIAKRFTQQRAAQAAGISRRQWIRYELGSKVHLKRLHAIAHALNIPGRRILYLAGYKTSPRRNDANHRLRRMHDMLLAGSLEDALEELLWLYDQIRPSNGRFSSDLDGLTAPSFAGAVILLEGLPKWLFEVILRCMHNRFSQQINQGEMECSLRDLVLKESIEELQRLAPPPLQMAPHSISVLLTAPHGSSER